MFACVHVCVHVRGHACACVFECVRASVSVCVCACTCVMNLPLPSLPFLLSLVYPSPLAARASAYRGLNKRLDYEPERRDPKRVQQCMAKASNAAIRCPAHAFVHRRRPQAPPHARTDRAGTDSRPSPSSLVDPCCGPVLVHQDHALQQQQSREREARHMEESPLPSTAKKDGATRLHGGFEWTKKVSVCMFTCTCTWPMCYVYMWYSHLVQATVL